MNSMINATSNHRSILGGDLIAADGATGDANSNAFIRQNKPSTIRGGSIEQFPGKLHNMMEYVERKNLESIVSWELGGRAVMVHNPEHLTKILPLFFGQTKFRSFQRQMNMWHFERVQDGPCKGAFMHPLFLRGQKALCAHMSRHMDLESLKRKLSGGVVGGDDGFDSGNVCNNSSSSSATSSTVKHSKPKKANKRTKDTSSDGIGKIRGSGSDSQSPINKKQESVNDKYRRSLDIMNIMFSAESIYRAANLEDVFSMGGIWDDNNDGGEDNDNDNGSCSISSFSFSVDDPFHDGDLVSFEGRRFHFVGDGVDC